ncbi:hypothetical protein MSAN_02120200 [Mycena sanguinolenta]|uniref:Uncharacterized protein n=1 Tax=Mycena sanguinolenta TaxID=230812 RepID=A0A8H6XFH0_9AGAR|nr:hypothetical protein MSAN_02120200 [Mycena sanguinolenta]
MLRPPVTTVTPAVDPHASATPSRPSHRPRRPYPPPRFVRRLYALPPLPVAPLRRPLSRPGPCHSTSHAPDCVFATASPRSAVLAPSSPLSPLPPALPPTSSPRSTLRPTVTDVTPAAPRHRATSLPATTVLPYPCPSPHTCLSFPATRRRRATRHPLPARRCCRTPARVARAPPAVSTLRPYRVSRCLATALPFRSPSRRALPSAPMSPLSSPLDRLQSALHAARPRTP